MAVQHYTFTIDGKRVGYFEIAENADGIFMNAYIAVGGERQANAFSLRLHNGQPAKVKMDDGPWQAVPEGTWPTSGYPLIVRAGLSRYRAFVEGNGKIEERTVHAEDGLLVEYADGNIIRKFALDGDRIVYICWGGTAESRLVASRADAVRGTVYE